LETVHKPQLQGLGRKTLREIATERGIEVSVLIEVLRKSNIKANPDDKLKAVAESNGKTPLEIAEIIK